MRRAPTDAFERRLYEAYIEAALAKWPLYDASVGKYDAQAGVWALHITKREGVSTPFLTPPPTFSERLADFGNFFPPQVDGTVWLESNDNTERMTPQTWWRVEGTSVGTQTNCDYAPVLVDEDFKTP